MADKGYGADFFVGFVIGGLVGAAAAILFAPHSGEETRALIRERGIELQERSAELSNEARRRAKEYEAVARERAASWQESAQMGTDQGKAAIQQEIEVADSPVEDLEEEL